jgi:hypothetical protein
MHSFVISALVLLIRFYSSVCIGVKRETACFRCLAQGRESIHDGAAFVVEQNLGHLALPTQVCAVWIRTGEWRQ